MRTRKLRYNKSNYKELSSVKLPRGTKRSQRTMAEDQLYPVNILEKRDGQVKVHYVGYDDEYDEWKEEGDLEDLNEDSNEHHLEASLSDNVVMEAYSLYKDLGVRIKRGLLCSRTSSPLIKVVMPFDMLLFNGGLKEAGIRSKKVGGVQHYKITHYRDLDVLLGRNWHVRGINANGDYGFVVCDTVDFCLKKSRKLVDYVPTDNGPRCCTIDPGYTLTFSFVFNYGLPDTFGKDPVVFYHNL